MSSPAARPVTATEVTATRVFIGATPGRAADGTSTALAVPEGGALMDGTARAATEPAYLVVHREDGTSQVVAPEAGLSAGLDAARAPHDVIDAEFEPLDAHEGAPAPTATADRALAVDLRAPTYAGLDASASLTRYANELVDGARRLDAPAVETTSRARRAEDADEASLSDLLHRTGGATASADLERLQHAVANRGSAAAPPPPAPPQVDQRPGEPERVPAPETPAPERAERNVGEVKSGRDVVGAKPEFERAADARLDRLDVGYREYAVPEKLASERATGPAGQDEMTYVRDGVETTARGGYQQDGRILEATPERVVQDIGQNKTAVYDTSDLLRRASDPAALSAALGHAAEHGASMQLGVTRGGDVQARDLVQQQGLERGQDLGRSRSFGGG